MKKYLWFVLLIPLFIYGTAKSSLSGRKNVNSWDEVRNMKNLSSESILKKGGGGPDSLGYQWTDEIPYNWIDITVIGDSVPADDDWNDSVFYLADEFVFYGDTFDSLAICSNGWLSFTDFISTEYDPYPIPDSLNPLNLLAPLFWDLNPDDGGVIYYYADTLNKRTIIEWYQIPYYSIGVANTFEVILNSNDNSITFQYNSSTFWNDSAVVGIQNGNGTIGLSVPSTNIHNGYALKFYRSLHSISLSSIEEPGSYVPADSTIYPVGIIKNTGANPEGPFDVICQIDLGLTRVYTDTIPVLNLGVDSVDTIIFFDPWSNSDEEGIRYNVTMFTNLIGDDYPYDDTLSYYTDVFQITNRISSRYTPTPPTLDGFIGFEEWGYARRKDVSDILGYGAPVGLPPGQAYLYVMNDSSNLYFGIDGVYDLTADNEDVFWMYFDDNNDHSYPSFPDSTEGTLWLEWYNNGDSLYFAPVTSDSGELAGYSCSFMRGINKIPGNMQYEIAIPLDSPLNEGLQANIGDTIRTWFFVGDAYYYTIYGWWPTDDPIGWGDIDGMGEIVLATPPSGIEDDSDEYSGEYRFKLYQNTPNPFGGKTSITYEIPDRSFVSLKIYNATGQLIKIIEEGEKEAGRYTYVWDGYNKYGNKVPAGVYFYNLEADRNRIIKKMILIR